MFRNPDDVKLTTQIEPELKFVKNDKKDKKKLICAKNGMAGLGSLSDHGSIKGHGWEQKDYKYIYNHGRGGQFWRFRKFMLRNMGIEDYDERDNSPLLVVFSEHSSVSRDIDMTKQMNTLKAAISDKSRVGDDFPPVDVEGYQFSKHTLYDQAKLVSRAAVYVTACGGGAATATFLPRGASLMLYFQQGGGFEKNKRTGKPAYLDYDYLNNIGYVHVHWVPDKTRNTQPDLEALVDLILHELRRFHQERLERWRHQ